MRVNPMCANSRVARVELLAVVCVMARVFLVVPVMLPPTTTISRPLSLTRNMQS